MVGKLGSFMDTTSLKPDNAFLCHVKATFEDKPGNIQNTANLRAGANHE